MVINLYPKLNKVFRILDFFKYYFYSDKLYLKLF